MSNSPRQTTPPAWKAVLREIAQIPSRIVIGLVRFYQLALSPIFGGRCRFYPSCSEYFILAVRKYGVLSGSLRGMCRILRCHPFHPGGYDPP
jgi:putative membrane protein insertion efficiency factor